MKILIVSIVLILSAILTAGSLAVQAGEVWYSPNVASVDYLDLFNSPEQWPTARSRIDVFKFYSGQVGSGGWSCNVNPSAACGMNYLENLVNVDAFSKLGQWGVDIAIESFFAGPVMSADPITCSTAQHVYNLTLSGSVNFIQNVEANGGVVHCLTMDEPIRQWLPAYYYIHTGQTDPRPCLVDSIGALADHMAAYLQQMAVWFPSIPVGHTELYPEVSVDMFKEWIYALEARGATIPFLHLDVHGHRVDQYIGFGLDVDLAADFAELKSFLNARGIEFGVIMTDVYWDSQLWEPGTYTDQTYYEAAMDWTSTVKATGVNPDDWIFQSWVKPYYTTGTGPNEVPVNLPEDDPVGYNHTRLINDALGTIIAVEDEPLPIPARCSLSQNRPNPFSRKTSITYDVSSASHVTLTVFDVRGREVRTRIDAYKPAGKYTIDLDARDIPAGVYIYTLRAGGRLEAKKMLMLR